MKQLIIKKAFKIPKTGVIVDEGDQINVYPKLREFGNRSSLEPELLIDGHAGIYVPQEFINSYRPRDWGVKRDDIQTLQNGPDDEYYWDAWNSVLNYAKARIKGATYTLYQDQDLWAIPEGYEGELFDSKKRTPNLKEVDDTVVKIKELEAQIKQLEVDKANTDDKTQKDSIQANIDSLKDRLDRMKESVLKEADVDVSKLIKDMRGDFGGDNSKQMKGLQLMKGLATSDDPKANEFMKKINDAMTKISKEVLGEKSESRLLVEKKKIGRLVLRKYTNSTIETDSFDGRLKDFFTKKNVNQKVLKYCEIDICLSHAFGFSVEIKRTGEWGNETYYDIYKD